MKHTPPMGVIAPIVRTPERASVYRLPEKISTPAASSQQTYDALALHGPHTTRELSRLSGIDLLTLRPRMTELCLMGFAECIGTEGVGHNAEGIYRAISMESARVHYEHQLAERKNQMLLNLV